MYYYYNMISNKSYFFNLVIYFGKYYLTGVTPLFTRALTHHNVIAIILREKYSRRFLS